jgi:hypothetical protein
MIGLGIVLLATICGSQWEIGMENSFRMSDVDRKLLSSFKSLSNQNACCIVSLLF